MTADVQQYPFAAIVAQERMKLALLLHAIDPAIGGVLLRGEKGAAKSTIVRALGALLPPLAVVAGCPYSCDPTAPFAGCPHCADGARTPSVRPARVVELPLGATEDRVIGTIDLERALRAGERRFEPGLLAAAHRGVLYVDEVNLLPDHLVDLLLDAAASGRNVVEREGMSFAHPARFVLIGTMNPEEGELRPQLLDRFGLAIDVGGLAEPRERAEVVRRRIAYEADPAAFAARWAVEEEVTRTRLAAARALLPGVTLDDALLDLIATICAGSGVEGLRADLTIYKAARALAIWSGREMVEAEDVRLAAELALPHRRRRPFEGSGFDQERLDQLMAERREREQREREGPAADESPMNPPAAPPPAPPVPPETNAESSAADDDTISPLTDADDSQDGPESSRTEHAVPDRGTGADDDGNSETYAARAAALPALPPAPADVDRRRQAREAARRGATGAGWGGPGRPGAIVPAARAGADDNTVAVGATIGAAASRSAGRGGATSGGAPSLKVEPGDLHMRRREPALGRCILFVVDASGSMAAQGRMALAKGAVGQLLREAYGRRERVGLIAFRGGGAELLLPPTGSAELAETRLGTLATGGRTPLAHGLRLAREVFDRPGQRGGAALLVVISDGRANVPIAAGDPLADAHEQARFLRAAGVQALVLDSEAGALRLGLAARLATELGAACHPLIPLDAGGVEATVRTIGLREAFDPRLHER
jgi:magnesium chelatase subunit D